MKLPFICKKPIISSLLKIVPLKFPMYFFNDFNILFKNVRHQKIDFLQPKLFWISLSMNIFFLKDDSFPL